jgi:hypothetical protein
VLGATALPFAAHFLGVLSSFQEFGVKAEYDGEYIIGEAIWQRSKPARARRSFHSALCFQVEREVARAPDEREV